MLGQLQSFRQSADQAEGQVSHAEAMACRYIEQLIVLGLSLYNAQQDLVLLWKAGGGDGGISRARELEQVWREMSQAFDVLSRAIRTAQRMGYDVAGAATFRQVYGELGAMLAMSIDRAVRAEEQIRAGKTIPLAEVRRELLG